MLPKKKRYWVWCTEQPLAVEGKDGWAYGDRVRNKIGTLTKITHQFIRDENGKLARDTNGKLVGMKKLDKPIISFKPKKRLPSRVICPHCKKKFKPRIRECHDEGCWHVYVPAHKKLV
jgi:hypothetical protein